MLRSRTSANAGASTGSSRKQQNNVDDRNSMNSSKKGIKGKRKMKSTGSSAGSIRSFVMVIIGNSVLVMLLFYFASRRNNNNINVHHNHNSALLQNKKNDILLSQSNTNNIENTNIDANIKSLYDLGTIVGDGSSTVDLSNYKGYVSLIVNVACAWGKTELTYKQLIELQKKYAHDKFVIFAFPTNDFRQEPGTDDEIRDFVLSHFGRQTQQEGGVGHSQDLHAGGIEEGERKDTDDSDYDDTNYEEHSDLYGMVIFPKMALSKNPVYQFLSKFPSVYNTPASKRLGGGGGGAFEPIAGVRHNFYKFIIDRDGMPVTFHTKKEEPLSFEDEIVKQIHRSM